MELDLLVPLGESRVVRPVRDGVVNVAGRRGKLGVRIEAKAGQLLQVIRARDGVITWRQIPNQPRGGLTMEMDSYYELRFSDGTSEKLDGVGTLESAKATAKTVFSLTGRKGQLVKVQPIDHTAPARTRGTSSDDG